MPGPPPKDPKIRQRRNKVSTRAKLAAATSDQVDGRISPPLPERSKSEKPWHPETVEFWREVWASPMAAEYLPADVPGLIKLAKLVDDFNYGEHRLAAEIRLQRQCYGLTPLDRRRLQWEIERGDAAEQRRATRGKKPGAKPRKSRDVLRAIK